MFDILQVVAPRADGCWHAMSSWHDVDVDVDVDVHAPFPISLIPHPHSSSVIHLIPLPVGIWDAEI
jgi:hypothetical protein